MAWRNANAHFIVPSMRLNFYRAVCWDPIENYFVDRSCLFCFLYIFFPTNISFEFENPFLVYFYGDTTAGQVPHLQQDNVYNENLWPSLRKILYFYWSIPFWKPFFSRRLIRKPCEASCVAENKLETYDRPNCFGFVEQPFTLNCLTPWVFPSILLYIHPQNLRTFKIKFQC